MKSDLQRTHVAAQLAGGVKKLGHKNVENYLVSLRRLYNDVPYHNWFHGMSTCNLVFLLVQEACVRLEQIDLLAIWLGALGHDAGHRGRNNPYECRVRSDLCIRYNDISVLEMHHAAVSFD